ncbi:MAG: hypothetical protein JXR96_26605 [Deltaproteobacteria bacterium]|nr:hypothetical protein [Deltaproteobacteria bacterium]
MAALMATAGMLVFTAIPGFTLVYILHGAFCGEPIDRGAWIAVPIYNVPALIGLLIGLRAWLRILRKEELGPGRTLMRIAPLLWAAGLAFGGFFAWHISSERVANLPAFDRSDCERLLGEKPEPGEIEACLPIAKACRFETRDGPGLDFPGGMPGPGQWPEGLRMPLGAVQRAKLKCIYDRWRARSGSEE